LAARMTVAGMADFSKRGTGAFYYWLTQIIGKACHSEIRT
jgi:hypothetical protein